MLYALQWHKKLKIGWFAFDLFTIEINILMFLGIIGINTDIFQWKVTGFHST